MVFLLISMGILAYLILLAAVVIGINVKGASKIALPISVATCFITVICILLTGNLITSGRNSFPAYVERDNENSVSRDSTSVDPEYSDSNISYQSSANPSPVVDGSEDIFRTIVTLAFEDLSELSIDERNVVKEAQNYLILFPYSRQKLIDQLSLEYGSGYSVEDATFAVDYLEEKKIVDWNEQAARSAKTYIETMPFSRAGLVQQLASDAGERFTLEQAEYGVSFIENNNIVNWNEQAFQSAKLYLETMAYSRRGLVDQLSSEFGSQFTIEQAEYGVASLETEGIVDWNEQAARAAQQYLDVMPYSRSELLEQLSSEYGSKFTLEQAEYGVSSTGL